MLCLAEPSETGSNKEMDRLNEVRILRPTFDAWIGRVILPAVFIIALLVTALNLLGNFQGLVWLALGLLPGVGLVVGAYAIPVLVGRIVIDQHGLACNVDGIRLGLAWRDIRAVRIMVQDWEPYLIVGVGSGIYVVPIHLFDAKALWESILWSAPGDVTRPEALEPFNRNGANEGIPPDLWVVGALRVGDHRGLMLAAGSGVVGFLFLFVILLLAGQPGAPVLLAFSVLYLLVLTGVGVTEFDQQGITRRTILGVTRILWDDLAVVEMAPFGLRISLEGNRGQRLVMFGPAMWTGLDAARAEHFLALQISTRRLKRRRSIAVLFKTSRNTRVECA